MHPRSQWPIPQLDVDLLVDTVWQLAAGTAHVTRYAPSIDYDVGTGLNVTSAHAHGAIVTAKFWKDLASSLQVQW